MRTPPTGTNRRLHHIQEENHPEQVLVRLLESRLEATARRRGCADHARDLAQSTLVDAICAMRRRLWRGEGPIDAYVWTILRRKIGEFRTAEAALESGQSLESVPAPGPDPQRAAEVSERRERLLRALQRLSSSHRHIVFLHYFEDLGVQEIGRLLGIPRGTVLSRLHYARRSVARLMRQRQRDHRASVSRTRSGAAGTSAA
jgi:RNA polymerase sigma-70 factor (ECF subfamily)